MPVYLVKKMNTNKVKSNTMLTGRTYRNYSTAILHDRINRYVDVNRLLLLDIIILVIIRVIQYILL